MANIHTPVTADVSKVNAPIRIRCKQGDVHSRYLNVTIVDFGVPVDLSAWDTAIINAEREDGESNAFECTISGNQVIAPIAAWMLLNAGWVRTSISVFSAGEVKLTTQTIMLQVEAAEYLGDDIDEDENYSILVDLIDDVQNLVDVTLSVPNKAADAATTGNKFAELNDGTFAVRPLPDIWAYGRIKGSNGYIVTAAANRKRTYQWLGVAAGIYTAATSETGYSFWVHAYNSAGTYQGSWDGSGWIKQDTGYLAVTSFDFRNYPSYKFRLTLHRDNDSSIMAADVIPVVFSQRPVLSNRRVLDESVNPAIDAVSAVVAGDVLGTYECTSSGRAEGVSAMAGYFRLHTSSSFGCIVSSSSYGPIFYVQAPADGCFHVETNKSGCNVRTSVGQPTAGDSVVWTGNFSTALPTATAPWLISKDTYVAVSCSSALASGDYVRFVFADVAYALADTVQLSNGMTGQVSEMIDSAIQPDYSTAENMSRVSDVYAALDAIENNSGSRMTHSDISDVIDDSTKIRAYKINTTPKYIDWEFDIQTSAPLFEKPKVLIIATIHGNERGNVLNLIEFCKNLLNNAEYADIAGRIEWHIIPVVNIWGYNHTMVDGQGNVIWYSTDGNYTVVENTSELRGGVYRNGSNINLNQAFSDDDTETTAETRAVRDYFLANAPFIACVDLHQWYTTAGSSAPVIGMASLVPDHNNLTQEYQRGNRALAAGGGEAETYARTRYGSGSSWWAKQQLVYPYGEPNFTTPASSRTSRAYFAGVGGNTAHTDKAVPFSSTFESAMIMRFMTNVYTPYTEMERICANVFVQKSLAALARAALEEFA